MELLLEGSVILDQKQPQFIRDLFEMFGYAVRFHIYGVSLAVRNIRKNLRHCAGLVLQLCGKEVDFFPFLLHNTPQKKGHDDGAF